MAKITLQQLTANNAAARAIPSIQSPPPTSGAAVGPQSLYSQTITIPSGQKYPVMARGDFVYIEGFTQAGTQLADRPSIVLTTDTENTPIDVLEPDRFIRYPDAFNFIEFSNSGAYTVYITFWTGFGDIRRDYGRRIFNFSQTTLASGPTLLAAGQAVVNNPVVFVAATSPNTQRARITKATIHKNSANITNADFTLFLFAKSFNTITTGAAFPFPPPPGMQAYDYLAQIRFPTFVTGGAGSTHSLCDLANLSIDIYSDARDPNGYRNGTIYGGLIANAAYTTAANENFTIILSAEWD